MDKERLKKIHKDLRKVDEDYHNRELELENYNWLINDPLGNNLLLKPEDLEPNQASMLTLVAAYAVAGGISEQTGLPAKIKWPNDIVVNGKKVCGILTEMSTEIEHINYIVCGIGINVNMTFFPEEIKDTATSLCLEYGQQVRRSTLIAAIMRQFEKGYQIFMETRNLEGLQEAYNDLPVSYTHLCVTRFRTRFWTH